MADKKPKVTITGVKTGAQTSGSGQILSRGKNGILTAARSANYNGVSNQTAKADRKVAAGTGNGSYGSGVAPRVGGALKKGPGKVVSYGNSSAISKGKIGKLKK